MASEKPAKTDTSRRKAIKVLVAVAGAAVLGGAGYYYLGQRQAPAPKELNWYNWYDYIEPNVLQQFEKETGVKVSYVEFSNLEEALTKIRTRQSGFDIAVITDYAILDAISEGLIRELDMSKIPNFSKVMKEPLNLQSPTYDPGPKKYTVPWMWGTTGIGWNTAEQFNISEITGWEGVLDPEFVRNYSGKVTMLDDPRETIGAALKYNGYSLNDTNPDHLEQAKQTLLGVKKYLAKFTAAEVKEGLIAENFLISHDYNTDIYLAAAENLAIRYVIPRQGGTVWVDNLTILTEAKNPEGAHALINWLLDPETEVTNSNYLFIANPLDLTYVRDNLDPAILEDPGIYPTPDTLGRLETIQALPETERALVEEIWDEVLRA